MRRKGKKNLKVNRILALLMTLCMGLSIMPVTAFAEEGIAETAKSVDETEMSSEAADISGTTLAAPTIIGQPSDATYTVGDVIEDEKNALSVKASLLGGTIAYQWYKNTLDSNTGGTIIDGATESIYKPDTSEIGTTYYYCVVRNTKGSASTTSDVAKVDILRKLITDASEPVIQTQPVGATYTEGDEATALSISVKEVSDVETLLYQWYSKETTDSAEEGTKIEGATKNTYKPDTSVVGTNYYYCVVTNLLWLGSDLKSKKTTSEVVEIVVNPKPVVFTVQPKGTTTASDYKISWETVSTSEVSLLMIDEEENETVLNSNITSPYTIAYKPQWHEKEIIYKLKTSYEGKDAFSDEFTIKWVDPGFTMASEQNQIVEYGSSVTIEFETGLSLWSDTEWKSINFYKKKSDETWEILTDKCLSSDTNMNTLSYDKASAGETVIYKMTISDGTNEYGSREFSITYEMPKFIVQPVSKTGDIDTVVSVPFAFDVESDEVVFNLQKENGRVWSTQTENVSSPISITVGENAEKYRIQAMLKGTDKAYYSNAFAISQAGVSIKEATPAATFSFDGENANKLMGTTSQMKYSVKNGEWLSCTEGSTDLSKDISKPLDKITTEYGIKIKTLGDGAFIIDSDIQTIAISKAEKPSGIEAVECATSSDDDGKLAGVTAAMEYRRYSAPAWTPGTGSDITGLTPGTYYVRVKATGTTMASEEISCFVRAYSPIIKIPSLDVSGITLPVEGENPDFEGILPSDVHYGFANAEQLEAAECRNSVITGICWKHKVGDTFVDMGKTDKFIAGDTYYFIVYIIPESSEYAVYNPGTTFYLNGQSEMVAYKDCLGTDGVFWMSSKELTAASSGTGGTDTPGTGGTDVPGTGGSDVPGAGGTDAPGTGGTPAPSNTSESVIKGQTYTVKSCKYKVTNANTTGKGTVTLVASTTKKTKLTSTSVPSTVKINGKTFKVTAISDNAFKNCKKLKKVTIGSNVTKIGKNAFYGCKVLKTITVKSKKVKTVGSGAFKGINKKCKIKVPSSKLKAYKKTFAKKGQAKTVKISK